MDEKNLLKKETINENETMHDRHIWPRNFSNNSTRRTGLKKHDHVEEERSSKALVWCLEMLKELEKGNNIIFLILLLFQNLLEGLC